MHDKGTEDKPKDPIVSWGRPMSYELINTGKLKAKKAGDTTIILHKDIDHFTVLINCSPQIALVAAYFREDPINEKSIAVTSIFTFQPFGVLGT